MWSFGYIVGRLYSVVLSVFSPTHRSNKGKEGRKELDDGVVEKKESNEELSHPGIGDKSHSKVLYFVVGLLLIGITYDWFDSDKVVSHLQKRELTTFPSVYGGDCFKDQDVDDCRVRAEQGDSSAQYNLGLAYQKGLGVPQDYKESVEWYRKSAEQGYSLAQNNLGVMYALGQGGLQDYVTAHMYWNIAAVGGLKSAIKGRGIVEKKMTSSQIEKAQDLAREWMRTHQ